MSVSALMPLSNGPATRRASTRRMARLARRRAPGGAVVLRPMEVRAHRGYTAADVQVLARIGQLLHLGHRCEEIKHLLPPPGRSDEQAGPYANTEDADLARWLRNLEDALARARAHVGSLEEQTVRYEHRLEAEQAAHAETRQTLREVQRKLVEAQRATAWLVEANLGLQAQVAQLERVVNAPVWQRVLESVSNWGQHFRRATQAGYRGAA
jgi:DNA-binding transcriptional MerR regulator